MTTFPRTSSAEQEVGDLSGSRDTPGASRHSDLQVLDSSTEQPSAPLL